MSREFQAGDPVIFRMRKHSTHPGPRAKNVMPQPRGEAYSYQVDKFWIVARVQEDGKLVLKTRRGKTHVVEPDDINLRRAHWWERWLYRDRFPKSTESAT
jgi:hypothetical protein